MQRPEDLLESIQRLREEWNEATDIPNPSFLGEGVTAYQFWLESRLVYRCRLIAELTYERNRWAELYRTREAELATAKQHIEAKNMRIEQQNVIISAYQSSGCVDADAMAMKYLDERAERDRLEQENKRLKAPVSDEDWIKRAELDELIAARAEQEKGEPQP